MHRPSVAFVLILAAPTLAQQDPEALATLTEAREAILAIEDVTYSCRAFTKGGLFDGLMPSFEAEVWQFRSEGNWLVRIDGKAEVPDKGTTEFTVVDDGTARLKTWIDHSKKTVFCRPSSMAKRAKSEAFNMSEYSYMKEMLDAAPLKRELEAPTMTLEGTEEVEGVACAVVLVDFGESRGQARWFVGAEDHLPRKIERITAGQGLEFKQVWEVRGLKVETDLTKESFALATPPDYGREEPPVAQPETGLITRMTPDGQLVTEMGEGQPAMPDVVVGLEPGNTAPEFSLSSREGAEVLHTATRGNVVVLGFWSSSLMPCRRAAPEIQKLHDTYSTRKFLMLLATCKEEPADAGSAWLEKNGSTYFVGTEADALAETYEVDVFPTFYILGFRGEIIHKEVGYKPGAGGTFEKIDSQISAYLASSGDAG